jgi:hypothetical protein
MACLPTDLGVPLRAYPLRAYALRARMIRVHEVLSTPCRNHIGGGSHEIDAILSRPAEKRGRRHDSPKMLSRKT